MNEQRTEGERRIRALIRAVISPGIWLVVFLQLAVVVARWSAPPDQPVQLLGRLALVAGAVTAMFYMVSGAYQALAATRSIVSMRAVIEAGRRAFFPLLGLVVKTGALGLAAAILVLLAARIAGLLGDAESAAPIIFTAAIAMSGVLSYLFVYWLPWVFVHQDFRVVPSLLAALDVFRARFSKSGFVALLTLGPTALALVLPNDSGLIVVLLVSLLNLMTAWSAYIYAAEYLGDQSGGA